MRDKFKATWVSHSSISDFLACPRAYYLKNVYKDPMTNHKVKVMTPALALGLVVHQVLESLSSIKTDERFREPLPNKYEAAWKQVSGKKGGFYSDEEEAKYKARGAAMIARVFNHPGPIKRLAVKISQDLPYYWISEEDNIILCGKVDWLEYLPESDSVHIIDFKTGKVREDAGSLQLPIYNLLVTNTQKRKVAKASYWYLEEHDTLTEKALPDLAESHQKVLAIAVKIKAARKLGKFDCPSGTDGCYSCRDYERILAGEAELVGVGEYNNDIYILPPKVNEEEIGASEIL